MPDEASRKQLQTVSRTLKALYGFDGLRFIDPFNFHVTLCFLGDQNRDMLTDLAEALDEKLAACTPPGALKLSQVQYFPFTSKPKVLAAMVEPCAQLEQLHRSVVSAIARDTSRYGEIMQQAKKFVPHVSLARVGKNIGSFNPIQYEVDDSFRFTELAIMKSTLSPNGSIYEALYQWDFTR